MFQILGMLCWLGCVICFIIVLIKLFQENGVLHGILGLICSLYTFIWGWINAGRLNIRNIMMIWTVLILIGMVTGFLGGGFYYSFGTPSTTP
jgi:hypothetical protein